MGEPAPKRTKFDLIGILDEQANLKIAKPLSNVHHQAALLPRGNALHKELYDFLLQVRRGIAKTLTDDEWSRVRSKQASIEIEARLGLISARGSNSRYTASIPGSGATCYDQQEMKGMNLEFVGGVSPPAFAAIKGGMPAVFPPVGKAIPKEVQAKDKVYTYEGGIRVVCGDDGKIRREVKEVKDKLDVVLPAAPYDMRVMVSVESLQPQGEEELDISLANSIRRRTRSTWQVPINYPTDNYCAYWRMDATTVEVLRQDHNDVGADPEGEEVYEVELELLPAMQAQWIEQKDEAKIQSMTNHLATSLAWVLEKINPAEALTPASDPTKEDRHEVAAAARGRCDYLRRIGKAGGGEGFPGAMPVNMCRRHIGEVQRTPYFITEKTDGTRYLFVVVKLPNDEGMACVLVDRKMNCFKVEGGHILGPILGAGTVLDGELVFNRERRAAVFMMFDLLAIGERSVLTVPFSKRFQCVTDQIMQAYRTALASPGGALTAPHTAPVGSNGTTVENSIIPHLGLVQKRYFQRADIADLLRCVTTSSGPGGERVYRDQEGRHHRTDGVIFQPDSAYVVGTDNALLKWKWIDLASIDLRAQMNNGVLELSTEASGGVPVDMTSVVRLAEHDKKRLLADLTATRLSIAEVAFDPGSGLWGFMKLRHDKDRPNFITTVMSTLVELAEGITQEELHYRMSCSDHSEDDWSKHLAKMQHQLINFQADEKQKKRNRRQTM